MRNFIKKFIPGRLLLVLKYLYRKMLKLAIRPRLVKSKYDVLSTLDYVLAENKYGKYCVPVSSRDRLAAQKVLSGDVYEPDTIEFMISYCRDGDIVHAGTYFGDFLPALSRACVSQAKIWAFEPNPENFRCAKKTVEINELHNVVINNMGLGERVESLIMMTTDDNGKALGGRSRLLNIDNNKFSGGIETVQIVAIDEMIPSDRSVSIVQLDVEGHEKRALTGALKTIQRCLPIIIVEAYSDRLFESEWFLKNLSPLGYKIRQKIHNNTILMCDE